MTSMDAEEFRTADTTALSDALRGGATTTEHLLRTFHELVETLDRSGPRLGSVLAVREDSRSLESPGTDARGRLCGIPVLLKDNIDFLDGPVSTAGSFALIDSRPKRNAPVVDRLIAAGMVPSGSANMSEWANFRSSRSVSGWSGRGGLTVNPHALDRSAGGSSSGSAVAVAAGIVPLALGTETDGSILNPASYNGIVGLKPTVGLVDGRGVIPISRSQDTVGPMGRTVLDVARLLSVLTGGNYEHAATGQSVAAMRIGLLATVYWAQNPAIAELTERATRALADSGAHIVEDVEIPGCAELAESGIERTRLLADFRADLASYLATRVGSGPRSVADVIEFNSRHAQRELNYFGQDLLEASVETEGMSAAEYQRVIDDCVRCGRDEGIDAALRLAGVDCLMAPVYEPAPKIDLINGDPGGWTGRRSVSAVQAAAVAGYPGVSVPVGSVGGMPIGMVIFGTAHAESSLLAVASCLERVLDARVTPGFRMPQAG